MINNLFSRVFRKVVSVVQIVMLGSLLAFGYVSSVGSSGVLTGSSVVAYARSNESISINQTSLPFIKVDSDSGISEVVNNINNQIQTDLYVGDSLTTTVTKGWKLLYWDANNMKVSLDRVTFTEYDVNTRKKIMDIALKNLSEERSGGISARDRARLYAFVEDQDTKVASTLKALNTDVDADVYRASNLLEPLYPFLNTWLGLLVILISAFSLLQVAFDLFCMNTPVVMHFTLKRYSSKHPWYMSPEAWYAYKESIGGSVYKNYITVYMRNSTVKFIFTSFSIALIITHNIASLALFIANFIHR